MSKYALLLYTKLPTEGQVKTRLTIGTPSLSSLEAADFYKAVLTDLIFLFSENQNIFDFFICPKGNHDEFKSHFNYNFRMIEDKGNGDLGKSLYLSFIQLLNQGYQKVIIIGSDAPFLTIELIHSAFSSLNRNTHLTLGPDQGGGCYLIGCNKEINIFSNIPWSKGKDFSILCERSKQLNIETHILPLLNDIDLIDDFINLHKKIWQERHEFDQMLPNTVCFLKMFHVKHPNFF